MGRCQWERQRAQPFDHRQSLVDSIFALVACGVSRLTGNLAVEHHQSFLSHSGVHSRGFAHQSHVDFGQQRQNRLDASFSANFLLARGKEYEIVALLPLRQQQKGRREAHHRRSGVVAAETIDAFAVVVGRERVARPSVDRPHGVDMRVKEQGGPFMAVARRYCPHVVAAALHRASPCFQKILNYVCRRLFLPAHRRC